MRNSEKCFAMVAAGAFVLGVSGPVEAALHIGKGGSESATQPKPKKELNLKKSTSDFFKNTKQWGKNQIELGPVRFNRMVSHRMTPLALGLGLALTVGSGLHWGIDSAYATGGTEGGHTPGQSGEVSSNGAYDVNSSSYKEGVAAGQEYLQAMMDHKGKMSPEQTKEMFDNFVNFLQKARPEASLGEIQNRFDVSSFHKFVESLPGPQQRLLESVAEHANDPAFMAGVNKGTQVIPTVTLPDFISTPLDKVRSSVSDWASNVKQEDLGDVLAALKKLFENAK